MPILLLGLPPTVLVMPMLYYFSELAAGLGFLFALALGGLVWAISTMPSVVRVDERALTRARSGPIEPAGSAGLSVVVPTRNGEAVLAESLTAWAGRLGGDDELVVVDAGSTDGSLELLAAYAADAAFPVRVLDGPGLNVSAGRNRAIEAAANDWIACTDAGCVPARFRPPRSSGVRCCARPATGSAWCSGTGCCGRPRWSCSARSPS